MTILRILGSELDEPDYYIDAVVDEIDLDGSVHLVEDVESNAREWTVPLGSIEKLEAGNVAARHGDLTDPSHPLWQTVDKLYQHRNDEAVQQVKEEIETNAEDLFQTIVRANT